jgi:hypothetical protein
MLQLIDLEQLLIDQVSTRSENALGAVIWRLPLDRQVACLSNPPDRAN